MQAAKTLHVPDDWFEAMRLDLAGLPVQFPPRKKDSDLRSLRRKKRESVRSPLPPSDQE